MNEIPPRRQHEIKGQALGDTTTLADPTAVAKLKWQEEEEQRSIRKGTARSWEELTLFFLSLKGYFKLA